MSGFPYQGHAGLWQCPFLLVVCSWFQERTFFHWEMPLGSLSLPEDNIPSHIDSDLEVRYTIKSRKQTLGIVTTSANI